MWLYLLGIFLLIVGIGGGFVGGGVFSFIFIPLAIIAFGAAVFSGQASKRAAKQGGQDAIARPSSGRPLPHSAPAEPTSATTSPEALADRRRVEQ
jgi:hypothetical protein